MSSGGSPEVISAIALRPLHASATRYPTLSSNLRRSDLIEGSWSTTRTDLDLPSMRGAILKEGVGGGGSLGSSKVTVVQPTVVQPSVDRAAQIVPPCSSTIPFATARSRPRRPTFVVKKGSKAFSTQSSRSRGALSWHLTTRRPPPYEYCEDYHP